MNNDGNFFNHQNLYSTNPYDFHQEKRRRSPNLTPASTVLNSPDLIEVHHYQHKHQIKVGRSPVSQHDSGNSISPIMLLEDRDEDVDNDDDGGGDNCADTACSNGKVVFDDIDDHHWHTNSLHTHSDLSDNSSKTTKIIEYEGSPRRFGNYQHENEPQRPQSNLLLSSPTFIFPKKPGFPQRVTSPTTISSQVNNDYNNMLQEFLKENEVQLPAASTIKVSEELLSQKENISQTPPPTTTTTTTKDATTFDYLYEFSETRKVLEDFFKPTTMDDKIDSSYIDSESDIDRHSDNAYIGERLAKVANKDYVYNNSSRTQCGYVNYQSGDYDNNEIELYLDSNSRSSGELGDTELDPNTRRPSRHFTLSPESMDYDSNCGDLDSLSNNDLHGGGGGSGLMSGDGGGCGNNGTNGIGQIQDYGRLYTSMPVLEDGLSSGHASDTDNNNTNLQIVIVDKNALQPSLHNEFNEIVNGEGSNSCGGDDASMKTEQIDEPINERIYSSHNSQINTYENINSTINDDEPLPDVEATLRDIRTTLQRTKTLLGADENSINLSRLERNRASSPVWIRRQLSTSHDSINSDNNPSKPLNAEDEEADTDLETDRLLGQQRLDDQSFSDEKLNVCDRTHNNVIKSPRLPTQYSSATIRQGIGTSLTPSITSQPNECSAEDNNCLTSPAKSQKSHSSSTKSKDDSDKKSRNKEARRFWEPAVLIEGVLFRARYLGSTQLVCEGQPTKSTRMMQAEEAVSRIKAPEGETQPSTEVDLFISTEKIMVLNTDLKEIMMDHALRTISYIADIGDLVVLMARRRFVPQENEDAPKPNRTPKMICHVFESDEAQFIAQSIGQAFQVAYMEFLKANGIEDHSFVKEMDYQEVLNSQEIFGDELEIFAKKELQKEVVVPKSKGEILGVVIVESGWGSMLPTVVIANLLSTGAAARCGQLNIGDQIIAINGLSLVGLPLSTCQSYIRNTKNQTAVKFTVVPCPPVVEVKIKRPNTKYQLGFSVQNGVICSLLRGGIAERGGVRVGHRIIEINNQSVVAVPHEKIVSLLATSVGEILMKTMPTSMFRLLTGQENPIYI